MWKKVILILTLQYCANTSAKSISLGNHNEYPEQVSVNQHAYYTQQYGEALQELNSYVHKVQQQGLVQPFGHYQPPFILTNNANGYAYPSYPSYQVAYPNAHDQNGILVATPDVKDIPSLDAPFDELTVLQLIPIIIDQLKRNNMTANEKSSLEKIFGNSLWSLFEAEASRTDDVEMNPLLKTILNSDEVRLSKRDITEHFGNDIYKNSLRRVYRGDADTKKSLSKSQKPYISLDDDRKVLSPADRLLNMVAAIVHKSNVMEKSRQKAEREAKLKQKERALRRKNKKSKAVGNPLGIIKPRQRYVDRILGINRMKRSIIKFGTDLQDMRALLDQVNRENDLWGEQEQEQEDEEEQQSDEEYMDDDYDLYDYPQESNNLFDNDDDEDDYSFDSQPRRHRNIFDDYENGSVNEFIHLARQRDRREKNFFDKVQLMDDEYVDDDFEAYDDN